MISESLAKVQSQIIEACKRVDRDPKSVTLVAVGKLKPIEDLVAAVEAGAQELGENYVQEWKDKSENWPVSAPTPKWHLIGPLQTNKVKFVVGSMHMIHSVDRLELAQEIARRAERSGIKQKILVQLKIGTEETKHGIEIKNALELILTLCRLPSLEVCGLMALPPLTEDEETARGYFREVINARNEWVSQRPELETALKEISMGTSGDFLLAIEEGATIVRVGTAIFGERVTA